MFFLYPITQWLIFWIMSKNKINSLVADMFLNQALAFFEHLTVLLLLIINHVDLDVSLKKTYKKSLMIKWNVSRRWLARTKIIVEYSPATNLFCHRGQMCLTSLSEITRESLTNRCRHKHYDCVLVKILTRPNSINLITHNGRIVMKFT